MKEILVVTGWILFGIIGRIIGSRYDIVFGSFQVYSAGGTYARYEKISEIMETIMACVAGLFYLLMVVIDLVFRKILDRVSR